MIVALILGIVTAIIMLPLIQTGFIMTFDMAWGNHIPISNTDDNAYGIYGFINLLVFLVGAEFTQKLLLCSIIALSFSGFYMLTQTLLSHKSSIILSTVSLLGVFNPFFYTRLISGQWLVLLGYALLPWAVRSFFIFLQNPKFKTAWPVALWMSAIGLTSIHTIGIAVVAFIGLVIYFGVKNWKAKLKWLVAIAGVWCAVNATWLVPLVTNQSSVSSDIKNFSKTEMQAFATHGTILDSPPLSAALLTGFWADDTNRYILPSQLPIWWVGVFIIMSLVIAGIVQVVRKRDRLGFTFMGLGCVAWLLGIGIAWNVSAPLTEFLINVVPFYNGYREPQKWLMLLALVYVFLAAVGAQWIFSKIQKTKSVWLSYSFTTILIIAPFLYAPTLAWGAAGQLKSVQYPAQWQEAKIYLNTHANSSTQVLVLPWHMYLPISFVGRVVGNPTGYFFDQKMITGNNFGLEGVPNQNETALTTYVNTSLVRSGAIPSDVAKHLRENNIEYVLLLKEADWRSYQWLQGQSDLSLVVSNDKLQLYKVKKSEGGK